MSLWFWFAFHLMVGDVEYLVTCPWVICCLWQNVCLDLLILYCLVLLLVWVLYICYYFGYYPLPNTSLQILFPFCKLPFHSVMVSFAVQKLLNVMYSYLFIFDFVSFAFDVRFSNSFPDVRSNLPIVSSSFSVIVLTFKSLIRFDFCMVWDSDQTFFCLCDCPVSKHCLLKRLSFPLYSWFLCRGVTDSIRNKF